MYSHTICILYMHMYGFPGGSVHKESACNAGDTGSIPGSERSLGEEMATHSSILGWKIPWMEKTGGLWPPTPVFLVGKSHGWRRLAGYSPCGRKESDTTEGIWQKHTHIEGYRGDTSASGLLVHLCFRSRVSV